MDGDEKPCASKEETTIQIVREDCIAGMGRLEAESIDVVVTSPPYNHGVGYSTYRDRLPENLYLEWSARWLGEVFRVLKPEGSFFLNVASHRDSPLLPHRVLFAAVECGFVLQNSIVWVKSISLKSPDGRVVSRGHFNPTNSKALLNHCHESVFHLTKTGRVTVDRLAVGVPYADKTNIRRWSHTQGKDLRCGGNVWFVPYETIGYRHGRRAHPAAFPVALAERCIRLHGRFRPVVMDPFLGSGSAAVAAVIAGAGRFVGFEIDEKYVRLAEERVKMQIGTQFACAAGRD